MRELRSSTVSAREKATASAAGVKKKTAATTSNKGEASARSQDEKPQGKTEKSWKTRGRIKAPSVSTSQSPEPVKEENSDEADESKDKPEPSASKPSSPEPVAEERHEEVEERKAEVEEREAPEQDEKGDEVVLEEKEPMDNKENKSADATVAEVPAEEGAAAASSKSLKRKVADEALEEEAEEDSASEVKTTPIAASAKKVKSEVKDNVQAKKPRPVYDQESIDKAANAVIGGKIGAKKAAEQFGISRSVVERRVRVMRGLPSSSRRRSHEPKVQIIRVEDLD